MTELQKTFELIPAIDLKGGHCVRLQQGRMDDATDYGDDPAAMAAHWQSLGATRLHVVDLDGAFTGKPENHNAIRDICAQLSIPVQLGGGLRPGQICVGIDAKDGMVAVHGWDDVTGITAVDLARRFEDAGVTAIIYTDIDRDGMLTGPNIDETLKLAQSISIPVIVSGGISQLEDVQACAGHINDGIRGAITGRAIYEGTLDFTAAMQLLK